jgi:hypothetical protein
LPIGIPWILFSAIRGNNLYKDHVNKCLQEAREKAPSEKERYLIQKGGTSTGAAIGFCLGATAVATALYIFILTLIFGAALLGAAFMSIDQSDTNFAYENVTEEQERIFGEETEERSQPAGNVSAIEYTPAGNAKFGFWVDIPSNWNAVSNSTNGDGFTIDCGNLNVSMSASGSFGLAALGEEDYYGMLRESYDTINEFVFDNGSIGLVAKTDAKARYEQQKADGSTISFIIDYGNDAEWYEANQEILLHIAKSLRPGSAAEDSLTENGDSSFEQDLLFCFTVDPDSRTTSEFYNNFGDIVDLATFSDINDASVFYIAHKEWMIYTEGSNLNIRSEPSVNATIIGKYADGEVFNSTGRVILSEDGTFFLELGELYSEGWGWVSLDYLLAFEY